MARYESENQIENSFIKFLISMERIKHTVTKEGPHVYFMRKRRSDNMFKHNDIKQTQGNI